MFLLQFIMVMMQLFWIFKDDYINISSVKQHKKYHTNESLITEEVHKNMRIDP